MRPARQIAYVSPGTKTIRAPPIASYNGARMMGLVSKETEPTMSRKTGTDAHRVGSIVPENYRIVLSYSLSTTEDGQPVPSFGINCELDRRTFNKDGSILANGEHDADGRCCVIGLRQSGAKFAEHGGAGKCTVCGAAFGHGDVWQHTPSGEMIHVGHTCADKYELLAERGDYDARYESHKRNTAAARLAASNRVERDAFLAEHEGLAEAISFAETTKNETVLDIAARFHRFRSISPATIALLHKIIGEIKNPAAAEAHVAAPTGRTTYRGVSAKTQEGYAATEYRMTVKVTTPAGTWLAWGTIPQSIFDDAANKLHNEKGYVYHLRGCEVELTATLQPGRDAHFAIAARPAKARIVSVPAGAEKREPKPLADDADPFATFAAA